MSTTHSQHPHPHQGVEVYQGEYVFAELVDDEEPCTADDQDPPRRRPAADTIRRLTRGAAIALQVLGRHTTPGLRHGWQATVHWTTVGYMSDDEIRRRLVKKHLDTYTDQRDDTASDISRLNKKAQKLAREAVDFGLTREEASQLKDVTGELQRRRTAGTALARIPFDVEAVQPTADQIKSYRTHQGLARFAGVILPASAATIGVLLAAPLAGLITLPVLAGAAWWLGRHPLALTQRALPADLYGPTELEPPTRPADPANAAAATPADEDLTPYPIAQATTPEEAEEALRRAILHEGGDLDTVTDGRREPWGWSARVTFKTGSPDDLNADQTYKGLITLLRLRRNGLLIEGDPNAGEACTVRMLLADPFTPDLVGPLPYRPPLSASITDIFDFGVAMDASELAFSLAGLMLLMVADSGGGKSGIMLALAEAATSTVDAAVLNLDPVGTGVGDLGPAITLNATMSDKKIIAVLKFLLALCTARARLRAAYGWGNKWQVSPLHPALLVFVDEWPQLSPKAKALLIKLLLLGRKEAIWVYGGSQYGTKDHLGEAIGPKLSAKLLGACRRVDVTELLGGGALAEGYRADLIRAATHTAVNDAGQIYGVGLPGMPDRPIRYQVREIPAQLAARLGAERATAGLPDLTHTLTEAGLLLKWHELIKLCAGQPSPLGEDTPDLPEILALLREAFLRESDPTFLTMNQVHQHLRDEDPDQWGKWDDRDDQGRLRELGKTLARQLQKADVELSSERITELDGSPRGYYLADIEDAISSLS
ncbi:hypothetical protein M8Z33_42085 [Streptomyces sp. ZAF1911]|uniref:hypothetical protein n=1 Tax=Streptomyces sp. ZAF1911 TaxID=2944129 RepID=UPI00237ADE0B|nr:hypothetical protein [Streptomyces sp. ZAF1911]MDD9383129.1 hypothetical protein [Streptomyces sp. ZAF1911]